MRVTNRASTRNYLRHMNNALSNQAKIQERVSSGNRFERISEDVSSGVQAMNAKTELYKTEKHLSNVSSINETLTAAEDAMDTINTLLADINTKILKAINDPTSSNRKVLAQEIGAMKEEILQMVNSSYNGQFLFSGSNNYGAPFSVDKTTGKLSYNGVPVDDIQRRKDGTYFYEDANGTIHDVPLNEDIYMDIGLGIRMTGSQVDPQTGFNISYSGPDVLGFGKDDEDISNNIYNLLDDIEKAVKEEPFETDLVRKYGDKLTKMTDEFRGNLTDLGSKTQFLDTMENRLTKNANNLTQSIARYTGTDYVEESIHQATSDAVTKALYQLGSSVIPLSLMDFVR